MKGKTMKDNKETIYYMEDRQIKHVFGGICERCNVLSKEFAESHKNIIKYEDQIFRAKMVGDQQIARFYNSLAEDHRARYCELGGRLELLDKIHKSKGEVCK
jgi:hypothetical protein